VSTIGIKKIGGGDTGKCGHLNILTGTRGGSYKDNFDESK
jgi:hypothetical protein